ncbi:hypothetical protein [Halostella pelagica]|uniref:hypothetical protein n=1 Tax=Halostella pelagica TaxID=2583824 RepID=UPI00108116EC|nr:hypothetical protein [Halostella pelagica]
MYTKGTAAQTYRAVNQFAAALRSNLIGRPRTAVAVTVAALTLAVVSAQQVAARDAYLWIEHSLPTYAGEVTGVFLLAGAALVVLAAVATVLGAGLVPAALLAGAPAFGWAVTHTGAPITLQYAATYPVEMALLYGIVFGSVGYVFGNTLRRT